MGVRFKGHSEYQSTYKWKDSLKSASNEPAEELLAQEAGKPSYYLAYTLQEPPLQHKRRITDPYVTNQLLETTNPREIEELINGSPNPATEARRPKTSVKYSEPAGAKTKLIGPAAETAMSKTYQVKAKQPAVANPEVLKKKSLPSKHDYKLSPPKAPRFEKSAQPTVDYPHANPEPYLEDAKTEIVKSSLEKGLDDSVKAEIKMKTMAASVVPKVKPRVSEYSRNFPKWDNFSRSKPTLDDSEVVFKSHAGIPPYASDYIQRSSSYQREFKDWSRSASLARSRSLAARPQRARDDITVAAKSASSKNNKEFQDVRLTESTTKHLPPQVPQFPMRKLRTTYNSSFKDITRAELSKTAPVASDAKVKETPLVKEVGDLRQKAAYYGARHLGTHISRDHLGQLIAQNADKWDDPGSPASAEDMVENGELANALDLARSVKTAAPKMKTSYSKPDRPAGLPSKLQRSDFDPAKKGVIPSEAGKQRVNKVSCDEYQESEEANPRNELNMNDELVHSEDVSEDEADVEKGKETNFDQKKYIERSSNKTKVIASASTMKAEREYDLIPGSSRSSEGTPRPRFGLRNTLELGRVPTPEMGKTASKSKSYFPKSRHHLDRTTVIKPESGRADDNKCPKPRVKARPNSARPEIKSSEDHFGAPQLPHHKVQAENRKPKETNAAKPVHPKAKVDSWIVKSPRNHANTQYSFTPARSFGRPTGDTHEIVLNTSASESPSPMPFSTAVIERHQGNDEGFEEEAAMGLKYRSYGENRMRKAHKDHSNNYDMESLRLPLDSLKEKDDLDKVSITSLASSRSMASEILERARNRRDKLRVK